jgi:hypothetical protein
MSNLTKNSHWFCNECDSTAVKCARMVNGVKVKHDVMAKELVVSKKVADLEQNMEVRVVSEINKHR